MPTLNVFTLLVLCCIDITNWWDQEGPLSHILSVNLNVDGQPVPVFVKFLCGFCLLVIAAVTELSGVV